MYSFLSHNLGCKIISFFWIFMCPVLCPPWWNHQTVAHRLAGRRISTQNRVLKQPRTLLLSKLLEDKACVLFISVPPDHQEQPFCFISFLHRGSLLFCFSSVCVLCAPEFSSCKEWRCGGLSQAASRMSGSPLLLCLSTHAAVTWPPPRAKDCSGSGLLLRLTCSPLGC